MTTESFDWDESTEAKRLTVVLPGDTDVTEDEAREAIRALVDGDESNEDAGGSDAPESRTFSDSTTPRKFDRGYTGGN